MNYSLAAVLTACVLASTSGHGNPPLAPAGHECRPAAPLAQLRPTTFPGRAALRAQLRSTVPGVREQAAAVGAAIAARALTEAATAAVPAHSLLSKSH